VRTIVWVGLAILASNLFLFGWLVCNDALRQYRIARSRRRLEEQAGVVTLPSSLLIRRQRERKAVGVVIFAALILTLARVAAAPAARTVVSAADQTFQEGPTGGIGAPVSTGAGHESSSRGQSATSETRGVGPTLTPPATPAPTPVTDSDGGDAGARPSVAAVPTSSTTIHLVWAPVTDANSYDIQRSVDTMEWDPVITADGDQTAYTDTALLAGTTYYYRVVAYVAGHDASPSDPVSATTATEISTPVILAATGSVAAVTVVWGDVDGETGYRVERSPDGTSGWVTIGTAAQDSISFTDSGLESATVYSYRVFATSGDSESPPSGVASATTTSATSSAPQSARTLPSPSADKPNGG